MSAFFIQIHWVYPFLRRKVNKILWLNFGQKLSNINFIIWLILKLLTRQAFLIYSGTFANHNFSVIIPVFYVRRFLKKFFQAFLLDMAQVKNFYVMGQDIRPVGCRIKLYAWKIRTVKTKDNFMPVGAGKCFTLSFKDGTVSLYRPASGAG